MMIRGAKGGSTAGGPSGPIAADLFSRVTDPATSHPSQASGQAGPAVAVLAAIGDIKIAHTVFALPFALLGGVLARDPDETLARTIAQLVLIVVCMFFARTWAMLVNRIADARLDADNPRTAGRAVASGRLTRVEAIAVAAGSALLFIGVTSLFWAWLGNPWPLALSVPVLAWIAFYSFTKRFTWLCHVFLGGALAASPIAAAIAVRPEALAEIPALWWIAGMVTCWVAGFDVIYALQDERFDRETGLSSIPAALGARRAVMVSRVLHVAAYAALVTALLSTDLLGAAFTLAVGLTGVLLVAEHAVLQRSGLRGLPMAFFTLNGIISVILGAAGILDALLMQSSL